MLKLKVLKVWFGPHELDEHKSEKVSNEWGEKEAYRNVEGDFRVRRRKNYGEGFMLTVKAV